MMYVLASFGGMLLAGAACMGVFKRGWPWERGLLLLALGAFSFVAAQLWL